MTISVIITKLATSDLTALTWGEQDSIVSIIVLRMALFRPPKGKKRECERKSANEIKKNLTIYHKSPLTVRRVLLCKDNNHIKKRPNHPYSLI